MANYKDSLPLSLLYESPRCFAVRMHKAKMLVAMYDWISAYVKMANVPTANGLGISLSYLG